MAYQGFSTGDLDRDASALRLLVNDGHQLSYAQSFSKNMGLYGDNKVTRDKKFNFLCKVKESEQSPSCVTLLRNVLHWSPN